jgi:glycosyl transferase family 25
MIIYTFVKFFLVYYKEFGHIMDSTTIILIVLIFCALCLFIKSYSSNECMEENITDYLNSIPIFIINLKTRSKRKEKTLAELGRNKLQGTFIEAIDGRYLDAENLKKRGVVADDPQYRKLRRGEIGCYLSHLKCWDLILQSKKSYGLVLEDDVVFTKNFKCKFNDTFKHIKDLEWDIITLGRRCKPAWFNKKCLDGTSIYADSFYPAVVGYGTFAYIIKRDAIEKLLRTTFPISKPIDVVILEEYEKQNIKVISFKKDLATQYDIINSDTVAIK